MSKWVLIIGLTFVVGIQIGIKQGRGLEQRELQPVLEAGIARVEQTRAEIANYRQVLEILACESNFDHRAVGDGGKSIGIAQFQRPTFYRLARKAGYDGDWRSPKDQVRLLTWAVGNGYADEWSCAK